LLIAGGVEHVRIGRLSKILGVTRGGFYWLFKSRDELLSELLLDWQRTNTRPFEKILSAEHKGFDELNALKLVAHIGRYSNSLVTVFFKFRCNALSSVRI
jgi:AcrR family transcriptional regulator